MVKVSIIIPVYNAETYLEECIQSLLKQTLKECEFIFVNDGSVDNSLVILNKYKEIDKRIIIIDQENQGVSVARNQGLEIATGEYMAFVDADDYVKEDMYEVLYMKATEKKVDLVLSNIETKLEGHSLMMEYHFPKNTVLMEEYIQYEIIPYFIKDEKLNTACNKLYRSDLIKNNNLLFPKGVALGEDWLFNLSFFQKAKNFIYINYAGYYYREVDGSATRNQLEKDYFQRALQMYEMDIHSLIELKIDNNKIKKLKVDKFIKHVLSYVYIYFKPTKVMIWSERYQYVKRMVTHSKVQEALLVYWAEHYKQAGRYEKILLQLIRRKQVIGLYLITTYSRLRSN